MPSTTTVLYLAACQYPAGVLERSRQVQPGNLVACANQPGPGDRALSRMALERAHDEEQRQRSTLILAGDLIYADATAGFFDPSKLDQPWDRAWDARNDNPWLKMATGANRQIAVLDDHEIADNWEPSNHPARNADLVELMYRGRSRFIQRRPGGKTDMRDSNEWRTLWYEDTLDGHYLFVGDTRTERQARAPENLSDARLLGVKQMKTLKEGLYQAQQKKPNARKIIITSSMLLPRPLLLAGGDEPKAALKCDSWCGYPASLHELLAHIADHQIQHGLFLSGDEHLPCMATITVQRTDQPGLPCVKLHSVHTGALYAPYPFANARPADFIEKETFTFTIPSSVNGQPITKTYACVIRAQFPAVRHEGFVKITLQEDSTATAASTVTFMDARQPSADVTYAL